MAWSILNKLQHSTLWLRVKDTTFNFVNFLFPIIYNKLIDYKILKRPRIIFPPPEPVKLPPQYSRYDVDPELWTFLPEQHRLPEHLTTERSKETMEEFKKLSDERREEHLRFFKLEPNTCGTVSNIQNERIKKIIHTLSEKGMFVFPRVVDHWTTLGNFRSILQHGAFYGAQTLQRKSIAYTNSALEGVDVRNGDGNVICFSPGGFVDVSAIRGFNFSNVQVGSIKFDAAEKLDRVRIRVDATKIPNFGNYNTFFKMVDMAVVPPFHLKVKLTEELTVSITHGRKFRGTLGYAHKHLYLKFILKNEEKEHCAIVDISSLNDLIYYGTLQEADTAAMFFPFYFLEKSQNKEAAEKINDYLNTLDDDQLRKLIISLAQNMTLYSEFNVYGKLPLNERLIYDIHSVKTGLTYPLHPLTELQYQTVLNGFFTSGDISTLGTQPKKEPVELLSHYYDNRMTVLYGRHVHGYLSKPKYKETIDVSKLPPALFEAGYVETRPGIRSV
ncbi:MAG: hypothetical protein ACHQJ6_01395 [Candidatus Berkiellales bacterium]